MKYPFEKQSNPVIRALGILVAISLFSPSSSLAELSSDSSGEQKQSVGQVATIPLKHLHLISRIRRDGISIQLEEFLSLETWSQMLQFSWYYEENGSLVTKRVNVLVLNDDKSFLKVQYEPYKCHVQIHRRHEQQSSRWLDEFELDKRSPKNANSNEENTVSALESVMSVLEESPYQIHLSRHGNETKPEATVFGVSSLWLRAFLESTKPDSYQDSLVSWSTSLDSGLEIEYSLDTNKRYNQGDFNLPSIESIRLVDDRKTIDVVEIYDMDFSLERDVDQLIFQFPIGYGCSSNVYLPTAGFSFSEHQGSSLVQDLELVATRYSSASVAEVTVKPLTFARLTHPMNRSSKLTLLQSHDDHLRVIHDHNSQVEYTISQDEEGSQCTRRHLHLSSPMGQREPDPIDLDLGKSLTLHLTEQQIDSLLDPIGNNPKKLHYLLNIIKSPGAEEYVFESSEPHSSLATINRKSDMFAPSMSVVRVYGRKLEPPEPGNRWKRPRLSPLELIRVTAILFDEDRTRKLLELRLNLEPAQQLPSWSQRAKLFDLRPCADEQLELKVQYLEDPKFASYVANRDHELVEAFYRAANQLRGNGVDLAESSRIGASLNFLRVPRVELRSSQSDGLIELLISVIERSSPFYRFEQLDHSSFYSDESQYEQLMVSSAEECARLCQFHSCRAFAFNKLRLECTLSPISIYESDRLQVSKSVDSTLFSAPEDSSATAADEASLSEILTFLAHTNPMHQIDSLDRERRDTSSKNNPLFVLEMDDRASVASEFGPTLRRRLEPNKILVPRVPISIDLAGQGVRSFVASSFRTQLAGKSYQLNKLDDPTWTPEIILDADERVFMNKGQRTYLTLKRLYGIQLADCQTLCYNIDDWDARSNGSQVCTGFSFCSSINSMQRAQLQCILATRTDFSFTSSVLELVNEGDAVRSINSEEDLIMDREGCILSSRNNLDKFHGPIKLPDHVSGYDSLAGGYPNYDKLVELIGSPFEWLSVSVVQSSRVANDSLDRCAEECDRRNKPTVVCQAFDFCIITELPSEQRPDPYHEIKCQLFLTSQDGPLSEQQSQRARDLLLQPADNRINRSMNGSKIEKTSSCNRYLVSVRQNFVHLRQHKISAELAAILDRPQAERENDNLDECIHECYHRNDCLALQYCSSFDQTNFKAKRTCQLFGYPKDPQTAWQLTVSQNGEPMAMLSQFDRDCHVYLRRELNSLASLLVAEMPQLDTQHGDQGHWIGILISCLLIVSIVGVIYARQRGIL